MMGLSTIWIFSLLTWLSLVIENVHVSGIWYNDRQTTNTDDMERPDVEYQDILFQATELILSSKFQLKLVVDAYRSTNWTNLKEMKVMPEIFNRTTAILDRMNRTLERKLDLGFHFTDKDLPDPIDKVTAEKLTDCFREMRNNVDKFRTVKGLEDKDLWKATVEMRVQINSVIQELETQVPDLLEHMRFLRNRVNKSPYSF